MSDTGDDIIDTELGGDHSPGGEFTETEYENLGSRLQSSCCGICIGLFLFLGAFPLLYWNEGRAVERYDALNEAEAQVTSLANPWDVDSSYEGRLIHFSVNITNGNDDYSNDDSNNNTSSSSLIDPIFGITAPNALQLHRTAEMYQWVEDKRTTSQKTVGGGKKTTTTYSYDKKWRGYLVDSDLFRGNSGNTYGTGGQYRNPSEMEFMSQTFTADVIKIGAYELPEELISRINWDVPLSVTLDDITNATLKERARSYNGGYYFSAPYNNEYDDKIGDQRVFFRETPPSIITIVGVQSGGTLGAFVSESGEGGDVLLFQQGNLTSVEMFDAAEEENKWATWVIRLVGFLIMTLGLYLVFRPIEVFADIIPCVGSIVGCGLVFMAVLISAVLSLVTISVAWLVVRPEIGAIVLGVSLAVVGLCALGVKKFGKKKDDDDFVAEIGSSGGKVVEQPPPAAAAAVPTVMAAEEPPTVYALPEGQVMATAPQQQPYVYASTPQQEPTVVVSAEPYVPKY